MTTAYEVFWSAIPQGQIPVAFPIADEDGNTGLAAKGIGFLGNPKIEALALSDCPAARACVAIFALDFAKSQIPEGLHLVR